jgi:hypothetical protein
VKQRWQRRGENRVGVGRVGWHEPDATTAPRLGFLRSQRAEQQAPGTSTAARTGGSRS